MSAAILAILLIIVGLATAWNLEGWPGRVDDDEGTYVAQAWAIVYEHTLTHYSYWYDHPPLGWIQIAAFAWITDGFNRAASAVYVGREFIWCLTLVGCVLVYVICRRLLLRRATATVSLSRPSSLSGRLSLSRPSSLSGRLSLSRPSSLSGRLSLSGLASGVLW